MTGPEVHFRVADDADASRIATLLEALGYAPIREVDNPEARGRWIVETFSRRYRLTSRERDLLECMLAGQSAAETAGHLGDGPNDLRVAVERFAAAAAAARRERSRLPAPSIEPGPRLTNADALDLLDQVGPSLDPPKP